MFVACIFMFQDACSACGSANQCDIIRRRNVFFYLTFFTALLVHVCVISQGGF